MADMYSGGTSRKRLIIILVIVLAVVAIGIAVALVLVVRRRAGAPAPATTQGTSQPSGTSGALSPSGGEGSGTGTGTTTGTQPSGAAPVIVGMPLQTGTEQTLTADQQSAFDITGAATATYTILDQTKTLKGGTDLTDAQKTALGIPKETKATYQLSNEQTDGGGTAASLVVIVDPQTVPNVGPGDYVNTVFPVDQAQIGVETPMTDAQKQYFGYSADSNVSYTYVQPEAQAGETAQPVLVVNGPDQGGWVDSDHDGLSDSDEAKYGTDPNNPDTDGDGRLDGDEVRYEHTNPLVPDQAPAK